MIADMSQSGRAIAALLAVLGVVLVGGTLVPLASGGAAGTLALHAELRWVGGDATCPATTPSTIECHPHPGGPTAVPGLGEVAQSYLYLVEANPPAPECRASSGYNLADYPARLIVKGKGEIYLAVKGINDCLFRGPPSGTVLNNTQSFIVTGGSGAYVGASGAGTVEHAAVRNGAGVLGRDIWDGTLIVPGLEFDRAAPTISGAVDRIVRGPRRAKTARVTFKVSAKDNVDGSLPVTCRPRSGSRFRLGKTRVTCSATDTSANKATATFNVSVKRRR